MNSIAFIGEAIEYEARRQVEILEDGGSIEQETRLFDSNKGETRSMRSKEEAHDYRYFPDPDLLPLEFSQAFVDALKADLPELPDARRERLVKQYGLSLYQASVLAAEKERADYYEFMVREGAEAKEAANWLINEYLSRISHAEAEVSTTPSPKPLSVRLGPLGPYAASEIVDLITSGEMSRLQAKALMDLITKAGRRRSGRYPLDNRFVMLRLAHMHGLRQVRDAGALEKAVDDIIAANPDKVEQAKAKPAAIQWFVGQVMKSTGGKADPKAVNALLKSKLGI
jgi:aspartyl-tRNA(Asn)/glutamyl-tRNA(Gln) amidotransferase subunit B